MRLVIHIYSNGSFSFFLQKRLKVVLLKLHHLENGQPGTTHFFSHLSFYKRKSCRHFCSINWLAVQQDQISELSIHVGRDAMSEFGCNELVFFTITFQTNLCWKKTWKEFSTLSLILLRIGHINHWMTLKNWMIFLVISRSSEPAV